MPSIDPSGSAPEGLRMRLAATSLSTDQMLEVETAVALWLHDQAAERRAEFARQFNGHASQITEPDPNLRTYNAENKVQDLMGALEQSVKDARAARERRAVSGGGE